MSKKKKKTIQNYSHVIYTDEHSRKVRGKCELDNMYIKHPSSPSYCSSKSQISSVLQGSSSSVQPPGTVLTARPIKLDIRAHFPHLSLVGFLKAVIAASPSAVPELQAEDL